MEHSGLSFFLCADFSAENQKCQENSFEGDSMLRLSKVLLIAAMLLALTNFCNVAYGEENKRTTVTAETLFTEKSFIVGYGDGSIKEGRYQPLLMAGHFGIDLKRYFPGLRDQRGSLSLFVEPKFIAVTNHDKDYEFGAGIGIQYRYPCMDKISLYVMGSVGPHYISIETSEQAKGFAFSDEIGVGLYYHLTKKSAINVGYRFRHVSNAGLKTPNGGMNSQFVTVGYSVFFE
jgi:lipid A 3-O-deacylase